jgi:sulfur carrier protein
MNIILNHRPESINSNKDILSVSELLVIKAFTYKMIIVKINDVNVKKDDYSTSTIKEGDNVQVIHLISGG